MAERKKLDTFSLIDKFGLPFNRIKEEAQASANRRAEVMGWQDVTVRPVSMDNSSGSYEFEIWGFNLEGR
jgi:hypothetical protein